MNVCESVDNWLGEFIAELAMAERKFRHWPKDVIHASAIMSEEAGELTQAANDFYHGNGTRAQLEKEAIQCGAMALRFLLHLETYEHGK